MPRLAPSFALCQDDVVGEPGSYDVVIVTYNHADTLPACLAAVVKLDPGPQRVVVVDNASSDGSADIAAETDGVEVTREHRNTGFAAAANRGIGATGGAWVMLLNPDCAPRSDLATALLGAAADLPSGSRVGSLTPRLLRAEGPDLEPSPVIDAAGMVVTASGRHLDRGAGSPDDGSLAKPAWVFGGSAAAAMYLREALLDVAYPGGEIFAESFFAYREDAELAWRLQLRGWSCLYEPTASAVHRRGFRPEAGRSGHTAINRHSVRNRFLLRAHCADLGWHLRCFPWWLLRDLAVIGACLTVERASLSGLAEAWRLRGDAADRRRWVLGRRTVAPRQMARWFRRRGWVEEVAGS